MRVSLHNQIAITSWDHPIEALRAIARWFESGLCNDDELQAYIVELAMQMPEESWNSN